MRWPDGATPGPDFALWCAFAAERHAVLLRRLRGDAPPWSEDPILGAWRFTNAFRVADRVSQALLREALVGVRDPERAFLHALLFRIFNRPETWRMLCADPGPPEPTDAWFTAAAVRLDRALAEGQTLFSGAYVMPAAAGDFRDPRKHRNWLGILWSMLRDRLPHRIMDRPADAMALLRARPLVGEFLAYQFVTDLGYAWPFSLPERDFVALGPGSRRGIARCFGRGADGEAILRAIVAQQEELFAARGLVAPRLLGRALQPIDVQNLFCELDKYARVARPDQRLGPARIKRRFAPAGPLPALAWPERWERAAEAES